MAPALETTHTEDKWIRVARLADLKDGEPKRVPVISEVVDAWTKYNRENVGAVWLLKNRDEVRALSVTCPHLGCGVEKAAAGLRLPLPHVGVRRRRQARLGSLASRHGSRSTRASSATRTSGRSRSASRSTARACPTARKSDEHGPGGRRLARRAHRATARSCAHALDEPVPGGARWAYVFGSVLVGCITLQAVTGWAMMAYYAPSATTAWASVQHLPTAFRAAGSCAGCTTSARRRWSSPSALHLAQVALFGAYKTPREVNWWLGLGLLGITLGFALTGYLLPWDQKGYWATRVATNIAGTTPLVGRRSSRFCRAAPSTAASRSRASTRSTSASCRRSSWRCSSGTWSCSAGTASRRAPRPTNRRSTASTRRSSPRTSAALLVLVVVFVLAWREHGAPLDAPADPASDYPARPEWYFLSLFQLLKYFDGPLEIVGTLVIPGHCRRVHGASCPSGIARRAARSRRASSTSCRSPSWESPWSG